MVERSVSALLGYQFRHMSPDLGDPTKIDIQMVNGCKMLISNSYKGFPVFGLFSGTLSLDLVFP